MGRSGLQRDGVRICAVLVSLRKAWVGSDSREALGEYCDRPGVVNVRIFGRYHKADSRSDGACPNRCTRLLSSAAP